MKTIPLYGCSKKSHFFFLLEYIAKMAVCQVIGKLPWAYKTFATANMGEDCKSKPQTWGLGLFSLGFGCSPIIS